MRSPMNLAIVAYIRANGPTPLLALYDALAPEWHTAGEPIETYRLRIRKAINSLVRTQRRDRSGGPARQVRPWLVRVDDKGQGSAGVYALAGRVDLPKRGRPRQPPRAKVQPSVFRAVSSREARETVIAREVACAPLKQPLPDSSTFTGRIEVLPPGAVSPASALRFDHRRAA